MNRELAMLMNLSLLSPVVFASGCALFNPVDKYHEKPISGSDHGVYLSTGFERKDWYKEWGRDHSVRNCDVVDHDAPSTGFKPLHGKALRITIPKGEHLGADLRFRFAKDRDEQPEAMYLSYSLRFANDFQPVQGGKMPGFAGTYGQAGWGMRRPDGDDGWSARGSFSRPDVRGRITLGSYGYHVDQTKDHGDVWLWDRQQRGTLELNRWYRLEEFIKLNTPGKNDGILRAWVDGRLAFEKEDICFRTDRNLRIEEVWLNVYHGGQATAAHDYHLYIDDLVISEMRVK